MSRKHCRFTVVALALLVPSFVTSRAAAGDATITATTPARIRLTTGREVPGSIVVYSLGAAGVECKIDGKTFVRYGPGKVRSVSTADGQYLYDAANGGFTFKPHARAAADREATMDMQPKESSRPTVRSSPAAIYPDDYVRTYITGKRLGYDMDTVYVIRAMSKEQVKELRRLALLAGHDWDHMLLEQRLPIVRRILLEARYQACQDAAARRSGTPSYCKSSDERISLAIRKILCGLLADAVAETAREKVKKENSFEAALVYAAGKVSRDALIESGLRDAFPDAPEVGVRAIRRVVSLYLDGKLEFKSYTVESIKEEFIEALGKENPDLKAAGDVLDFLVRLHEAYSKR